MNSKTKKIVGIGLLTAIVVVLQSLAVGIKFGPFSVTFVLIPIVVGAALYGWIAGAWLGFIFGTIVLFTDAGAFLAISVPGTILTCLLKGIMAGLVAGLIYSALKKMNEYVAVLVAAISAPIVNTGIFLLGCRLFFYETIKGWAVAAEFENAGAYMIFGLVGLNFLVEMAVNVLLSVVIVRIINIGKKTLL